jgi:2-polyprenyl-3-methyl-5-hydroxy-6-metoxy-1,4-benzoquinol methylase
MVSTTLYHRGEHLNAADLIDTTSSCPWCGWTDMRRPVLQIQTAPDVWLLECPKCAAVSASHAPTDDVLGRYYSKYYQPGREAKATFQGVARFSNHIRKTAFRQVANKPLTILDFGGGNGVLSNGIATDLVRDGAARVDVVLVDYVDKPFAPESPHITITAVKSLDEVAGRQFDLVLASAVMEHLPRPVEPSRRLLEAVTPGGTFYARTPFVVPFLRITSAVGASFDFTFPGHVHDLGQLFWERFLNTLGATNGYELVSSRPSITETSFSESFLRTLAATALKAPWFMLGKWYSLVGGWEVFIRRAADTQIHSPLNG